MRLLLAAVAADEHQSRAARGDGDRHREVVRRCGLLQGAPDYQRIYAEWFALGSCSRTTAETRGVLCLTSLAGDFVADEDGRVTGADATNFFSMSGLSHAALRQVWVIVDSKRQGYLRFAKLVIVMQVYASLMHMSTVMFLSPMSPTALRA